jgi:hypothetical protein
LPAGTKEKDTPTSHPCACSGAPVCNCGPGGCCDNGGRSERDPTDSKFQIHSLNLCGKLSQGNCPLGEAPALPTSSEICQLANLDSKPICFLVLDLQKQLKGQPVDPPPKA